MLANIFSPWIWTQNRPIEGMALLLQWHLDPYSPGRVRGLKSRTFPLKQPNNQQPVDEDFNLTQVLILAEGAGRLPTVSEPTMAVLSSGSTDGATYCHGLPWQKISQHNTKTIRSGGWWHSMDNGFGHSNNCDKINIYRRLIFLTKCLEAVG